MEELKEVEEVWYFGYLGEKSYKSKNPFTKPIYDDENGNYKIVRVDEIPPFISMK